MSSASDSSHTLSPPSSESGVEPQDQEQLASSSSGSSSVALSQEADEPKEVVNERIYRIFSHLPRCNFDLSVRIKDTDCVKDLFHRLEEHPEIPKTFEGHAYNGVDLYWPDGAYLTYADWEKGFNSLIFNQKHEDLHIFVKGVREPSLGFDLRNRLEPCTYFPPVDQSSDNVMPTKSRDITDPRISNESPQHATESMFRPDHLSAVDDIPSGSQSHEETQCLCRTEAGFKILLERLDARYQLREPAESVPEIKGRKTASSFEVDPVSQEALGVPGLQHISTQEANSPSIPSPTVRLPEGIKGDQKALQPGEKNSILKNTAAAQKVEECQSPDVVRPKLNLSTGRYGTKGLEDTPEDEQATPPRRHEVRPPSIDTPSYLAQLSADPLNSVASNRILQMMKDEEVHPVSSLGLKLLDLVKDLQLNGGLAPQSRALALHDNPTKVDHKMSLKSALEPIEDRLNEFAGMLNVIAEVVGVDLKDEAEEKVVKDTSAVSTPCPSPVGKVGNDNTAPVPTQVQPTQAQMEETARNIPLPETTAPHQRSAGPSNILTSVLSAAEELCPPSSPSNGYQSPTAFHDYPVEPPFQPLFPLSHQGNRMEHLTMQPSSSAYPYQPILNSSRYNPYRHYPEPTGSRSGWSTCLRPSQPERGGSPRGPQALPPYEPQGSHLNEYRPVSMPPNPTSNWPNPHSYTEQAMPHRLPNHGALANPAPSGKVIAYGIPWSMWN